MREYLFQRINKSKSKWDFGKKSLYNKMYSITLDVTYYHFHKCFLKIFKFNPILKNLILIPV